jgi:hypothetical protein
MPYLRFWVMSLVALVFLGRGLPADEKPAKPGLAKTPEEAVQRFLKAQQTGDLEAMVPLTAGPVGKVYALMPAVFKTGQEFEAALDRKFGKDPAGRRMFDLKQTAVPGKFEIREKKEVTRDRVEVTVWTWRKVPAPQVKPGDRNRMEVALEDVLVAVKEGNGWKLLQPLPFSSRTMKQVRKKGAGGKEVRVLVAMEKFKEPTAAEIEKARKMVEEMTTALKELTTQSSGDRFKSRQEAVQAFQTRVKEIGRKYGDMGKGPPPPPPPPVKGGSPGKPPLEKRD